VSGLHAQLDLGINFEISTFVFQNVLYKSEVSNNVAKTTRQETIAPKEQARESKPKHNQRQATQIKEPQDANNTPRTRPKTQTSRKTLNP
jgi:hypothetical protein